MKKLYFLIFTLLIITGLELPAQDVKISLLSSDEKKIVIRVDFPEMKTEEVPVDGIPMDKITIRGTYPVLEEGAPELLSCSKSVIIPKEAKISCKIIDSVYTVIPNFDLAPSRGRLYRNVDPREIPYKKGTQYKQNTFLPSIPVVINEPYTLRDFYGVAATFYPYQYNPATKTLRLYQSLCVEIDLQSSENIPSPPKITREFHSIYQSHFLNYEASKYTPLTTDGDMLIISPNAFIPAVRPLAEWKIKNGIATEIVSSESIGTTSSAIKNFISNYYHVHPNLLYVLLVGDDTSVPPYIINQSASDNYYAEITPGDHYPDIILGRMSAETEDHVRIQVGKSVAYETNPPESSHFPVFAGIASREGPGYNGNYDYEHIREIQEMLTSFTYTNGYEFFEGSQGGLDAPGNPNASLISDAINEGVGIINYCGHGHWNIFATGMFYSQHVDRLTNYNKLPFIIASACLNGDYVNQTCFAETWLRATRNGQYTGAVATLMSTISQAWVPPMVGQYEMNAILSQSVAGNIKRDFGGIVFDGLLKILDTYDDYETTRTWLIFGDPSLSIRTDIPKTMSVIHPPILIPGEHTLTVKSPVEGAKVTISFRNTVIETGYVGDRKIDFQLPAFEEGDTLHLVASFFNYIPYEGTIIFSHKKPLGIYDFPIGEMTVYPNPAEGEIFLQLPAHIEKTWEARLYDGYGRLLEVKTFGPSETGMMDISPYSPGIYIITVNDGKNKWHSTKIIKQ